MEFIFKFYIKNSKLDNIYNNLETFFFKPERFDSIEKAKKAYSPSVHMEVDDIFKTWGGVFITGDKKNNSLMLLNIDNEIHFGEFRFKMFHPTLNKFQNIITFIEFFISENKILFGFLTEKEEFELKHREITYFPNGASVNAIVGCNLETLREYLPGIYHVTVFNPELATFFKLHQKVSILNSTVSIMANGSAIIKLDNNIITDGIKNVLTHELQIVNYLGQEYFFDINKPKDFKYSTILEFSDLLKK